jgi:photosystem II stability/assembly factor-like uncharacterized protein
MSRKRAALAGRAKSLLAILAGALVLVRTGAAQDPVGVGYECTEDDANALGLTCTMEDPCPVFLELASAATAGGRLLVTGNLHTRNVTLYGVLLASDDNGVTWTEAHERIRAAALEQIEFVDPMTVWINGESVDPLTRNPFFLMTTDGGRTWTQKLVSEDAKYGTIAQFHFDTPTHGELVLDASQGKNIRQELYETRTGGESWELEQVDNAPIRLKNGRTPSQDPNQQGQIRVRADASTGAFVVERGSGRTWNRVASFPIRVAECE